MHKLVYPISVYEFMLNKVNSEFILFFIIRQAKQGCLMLRTYAL